MTWFGQLKFSSNPLDVRPNTCLVGLEKQEQQLKNHILKEEVCFLNGLTGSGKTSLLMKVQDELKRHKFVYLDAHDLPRGFDLASELKKKRNFFDRISFRRYPRKQPVLIIDEFQATDPDLVLQARAKWEDPNRKRIRSIVISQISKNLKNVTQSFKERLGSRIIMLDTLDEEELTDVIRKRLQKGRLNYADKLSPEAMSFLVKASGGNPRRLLEYADEIFDFHFRKFKDRNPLLLDSYVVSYHGAREILGLGKVHVEGFDHLDKRKEHLQSTIAKANVDNFEKGFTEMEMKVLKFVRNSPKTAEQIAERFKIQKGTASRHLSMLRKKNAILPAGKTRDNRKKWQIEPAAKRMMVKV